MSKNKYTTHKVHETAHKCTTHIFKQQNSLEENIKATVMTEIRKGKMTAKEDGRVNM